MNVKPERTVFDGHYVNIFENRRIILGFTEMHFPLEDLSRLFNGYRTAELKQIHSNVIHFSSRVGPGTEGDGIILDQRDRIAVIKTADCTPLFFWDNKGTVGGVIHIGWQGLLKGIEKELLKLLREKSTDMKGLYFYMGPAVEKKCYEVGPDLYEKFSANQYRENIFCRHNRKKDKYLMDIKKGIRLSLIGAGISDRRVAGSALCTLCEAGRFPSHRRDPKSGQRIYNFLMLK